MHLDKKREEQLEKIEFELEEEYNQDSTEEQKSSEMIFETENENEKEKTEETRQVEINVEKMQNVEDLAKKKMKDLIFELTLFIILGA